MLTTFGICFIYVFRKLITDLLLLLLLSILLFKGLPLFGFLIFQFKNAPTFLCLSRDKIKRHSGKNAIVTSTKILPKKQDYSPLIFQIVLSTYKLDSFFKKKKNTHKLDSQNKNTFFLQKKKASPHARSAVMRLVEFKLEKPYGAFGEEALSHQEKKKLVKIQPQKAINYTVWVALKHCFIPLNIKGNLTDQNTMKRKDCYTMKEGTEFVIVYHRVSASTGPLAILRPPEPQTHSLFLSDSPSPSKNSVVLSIFLKSKNPNH